MKLNPKIFVLAGFLVIFAGFFIYNLATHSPWAIDALVSIALVILFYFLSEKLGFGWVSLIFVNLLLIFHNLGTIGLYSRVIWFFGYDKFLHFYSLFIVSIVFSGFLTKLFISKDEKLQSKKKFFIILAILGTAIFLGVLEKLIEYAGYEFGATWQGMFSPKDLPASITGTYCDYVDAMRDLISDILGALFGTLTYFLFKKNPWRR